MNFVKDLSRIGRSLEASPILRARFRDKILQAAARFLTGDRMQRRKLCAQYDAFFSDDRILPMMPRLLGKVFFEKKKHPVPVRVSRVSALQHTLAKARDNTYLYLGWGPCTYVAEEAASWRALVVTVIACGGCRSVKVGRTDFTAKELVENIMAVRSRVVCGSA